MWYGIFFANEVMRLQYFTIVEKGYDKEEVNQYIFQLIEKQEALQSKYYDLKKIYQKEMDKAEKKQIELEKQCQELRIRCGDIEERSSTEQKEVEKKTSKKKGWLEDLAFYGFLFVMILAVFLFWGGEGKGPKTFAGFSAFTVLTSSMEDEIPKGSIVITRYVDPNLLKTGDTITYMADEQTTITHQIIDINESFEDTGQRAFQTKGTMNDQPDEKLVPAGNVVGKVIFHNLTLGKIATFIRKNWPLLLFFIIIGFVLEKVLKKILSDGQEEKTGLSAKA